MLKEDIDRHLGKRVKAVLSWGEIRKGKLYHKGSEWIYYIDDYALIPTHFQSIQPCFIAEVEILED